MRPRDSLGAEKMSPAESFSLREVRIYMELLRSDFPMIYAWFGVFVPIYMRCSFTQFRILSVG